MLKSFAEVFVWESNEGNAFFCEGDGRRVGRPCGVEDEGGVCDGVVGRLVRHEEEPEGAEGQRDPGEGEAGEGEE